VSRTKVGVVATDISRETATFVFGNFNRCGSTGLQSGKVARNFSDEVVLTLEGFEIVRPEHDEDEPYMWQS
jgi:hypothetical protein